MSQKHIPKYLPGYGKSYALLSKAQAANTAVIFVHGFGGKPTSTWRNFQGLVDEYAAEYPWWAISDMFFYAYESVHTPIRRNAALLESFLESVWYDRWQGADSTTSRSKYKNMILVGHSEGAVVIRRLILDRYETIRLTVENSNPQANAKAMNSSIRTALNSDFILASHLRLFSPACMGTNFSSLLGFLTSFSHFVLAITASSLVRNELLPESPVLKTLQAGTEQAHAEFRTISGLYTQPLFGVPDQIVCSDSYKGEKLLWDNGYDHFGVCKPSYTHLRPLEFVRK